MIAVKRVIYLLNHFVYVHIIFGILHYKLRNQQAIHTATVNSVLY